MNLKKKLAETKTKIKENAPIIIAVTAGVVVGAAATYSIVTKKNINQLTTQNDTLVGMVEKLEEIKAARERMSKQERISIHDETEQEILGGSKDVWFDVNGKRFDLILHPED